MSGVCLCRAIARALKSCAPTVHARRTMPRTTVSLIRMPDRLTESRPQMTSFRQIQLTDNDPDVFNALQSLTVDGRLLFATRFVRLFAYGALSVVLVLYLVGLGLSEADTGLLLTATLLGDTVVSLYLTTRADRIGRRRMLIAGTALMVAAGLVFAITREMWVLVIAGTIGVISPSGQEVGPFLPIEQAA